MVSYWLLFGSLVSLLAFLFFWLTGIDDGLRNGLAVVTITGFLATMSIGGDKC